MCVARHVHITQNSKFAISLQRVKKTVSNAVDFLHVDKHESFLQIDTIILMEMVKYFRSSQNSKFAVSLQYLKKEVGMKLTFCMQINIKVSYKLISTLWVSKFSTRWYYHYLWAWSIILNIPKVTSLQFLYNISKNKLGMEFIFCMQINIKTSDADKYQ